MPFHVEVRRGFRRAWAFNLDEQKLRRTFLEPWRRGAAVALGDQDWDPRACTLRVLEGPVLEPAELAHGRGWRSAERSALDVTGTVLDSGRAVAVLAESADGERRLTDALLGLGMQPIGWPEVRARIPRTATDARLPLDGVVILLERPEPRASWLFEAGLALGAFGTRAIVAQSGDEPPPAEFGDVDVLRVDMQEPASLQALAERLREAGR